MNTSYETDRLILKICSPKEAGLVTDFYNRNFDDFSNYEPLTLQVHTVTYHKKNLQFEYDMFLQGKFVRYYILRKSNPLSIIGTVSFRDITHSFYKFCTIGYKIDQKMRRQGYAREAISFLSREIIKDLDLNRIEATVRPENVASIKLLESIGYVNEGLLREKVKINGVFRDHYMISLLARDVN